MSASSMRTLMFGQKLNWNFSRSRSRPDSTTAIVRTRIHNSLPIYSFFEHSSPPFIQLQTIEIRMQRQSSDRDPTKIVHSPPPPPPPPPPPLPPLLLLSLPVVPLSPFTFRSPESTLNPPSHRNDNTGAEEALRYTRRCRVGTMRWWGG